jgi:membrane protease YdiL (CAAX protease family)
MRGIFVRTTDGRVRAGWRYVLFVLALLLAGVLASVIRHVLHLPPLRSEEGLVLPGSLVVRGVLTLGLTLGVTAAFLRFLERRPFSSVGLPLHGPWGRGIAAGLLLGAAPVVLLVALLAATGHARVSFAVLTPADLLGRWLPLAVGFALVSSQEELMLRGYGLQALAEGGGRWFAALFTGALFGAMHAGNPGANVLGVVNTAANAVLLAWLVLRTGSLWIACAYHAGWNLTGAMLFGMRLSGLDHGGGLLAIRLAGPGWLTGGAYGFEGSALVGLLELVVLSFAVAFAPRLPGHPDLRRYFGAPPPRETAEPSSAP